MKLPVPYFVSYAHADVRDVNRLGEFLEPWLKASRSFEFGKWMDRQILPGEHWKAEIDQALANSRFGLLLLSPEFLASEFITRKELPLLLDKPLVVPVMVHPILFNGSMDLKGLEDRQVFRDSKGRAFDGCHGKADQRDFARELFSAMVALLEKYPC